MASLYQEPNESWAIQFKNKDGKRSTLRLGKISESTAILFHANFERLCDGKLTRAEETAWLPTLDRRVLRRLVEWGFADKSYLPADVVAKAAAKQAAKDEASIVRIGPFLDDYVARRDVKPRTKINFKQATAFLIERFGRDRPMGTVTKADADAWREWLSVEKKLGKNTIRRHCGRARQFFAAACDAEKISKNPFAKMKDCNVRENRERQHFVSVEVAAKIIDACPDNQWRLIFALARFGGLRTPSEIMPLRWGDIDVEHNRFRVTSPKTAHHEGHEERFVPLFPELRPLLAAVYDEAPPGTEFVITRYRDGNANLRTQFERIIRRAGVAPWPKLFQNLRSTRQTELVREYPMHVVCKWLGNSQLIAAKHYLQMQDEDFVAAAEKPNALNEARQKARQQEKDATVSDRTTLPRKGGIPLYSTPCNSLLTLEYPQQDSNL